MNAIMPTITINAPRAIPLLRHVPEGCMLFHATDDRAAPHIRPGDKAVIDPRDQEPQANELFLIEYNGALSPVKCIVETYQNKAIKSETGEVLWWCRRADSPRSWDEYQEAWASGRVVSTADGPYTFEGLAGRLLGRVVGIIDAEVSQPFTAAEYLALERMMGHEVYHETENGKLYICVYVGNRKAKNEREDAHIAGLYRFLYWQDTTPDWKEQIVAELDSERAAA